MGTTNGKANTANKVVPKMSFDILATRAGEGVELLGPASVVTLVLKLRAFIARDYHMPSSTASMFEQSRYSSDTPSQSLSMESHSSGRSGAFRALSSSQSPSVA